MEIYIQFWLTVLAVMFTADGAKKSNKDRKSSPQWKPSSMPAKNERSEFVYEGKSLTLDCKAQAHPKPTVRWLKDGQEIKSHNNVEVKKFELILTEITNDSRGNYTCMVSNKHGQIDWTFHVNVQVKIWPLIVDGPINVTQPVGSNVKFMCRVLNDPNAIIRWQKIHKDKNIDEGIPRAEFLPDSLDPQVLTLDSVTAEDEGEYRCMAGNVWGLIPISVWLTLQESVTVPELPQFSEMAKNNNMNNKNSLDKNNNDIDSQPSGGLEPNPAAKLDEDSRYNWDYNSEELDSSNSDQDTLFSTTKQPKISGNKRKKNGTKKYRKDRTTNYIEEDLIITSTVASIMTSSVTIMETIFTSTFEEIWKFDSQENSKEDAEARSNHVNKNELTETDRTDSEQSVGNENLKGSISSWTIYTIVGAVGGVILLIGLLAITLTVCCKKDENSVCKSTSV